MADKVVQLGSVEAAAGSTGSSTMTISFGGVTLSDYHQIWCPLVYKVNTGDAASTGGDELSLACGGTLNGDQAKWVGASTPSAQSLSASTMTVYGGIVTGADTASTGNNFNGAADFRIINPGMWESASSSGITECRIQFIVGAPRTAIAYGGASYKNMGGWGSVKTTTFTKMEVGLGGSANFGAPSRMDAYGWKR